MRVLVTGGAGFIGSSLVEKLVKEGHNIIIIDNMNDYYDPSIKENNIKGFVKTKVKFIKGDIRDQELINKIFKDNSIDLVVHLAAMAGVRYSIENPNLYYDVNVMGTLNLLEACRLNSVKKFVFASSSSVYGNNKSIPFKESDSVDHPISPYAASKKAGELMCHTYHHLHGMDIVALRFFTVYGPKQRPDLAIHKFTDLIYNNQPIPFFGDGTTQRDYTYIDDIIDGVTKSLHWCYNGQGVFEIFNIGESKTISLKDMVETISRVMNKNIKYNYLPMQEGDVERTYSDVSKARKLLGYNPSTEFSQGIKLFYEWYLANRGE